MSGAMIMPVEARRLQPLITFSYNTLDAGLADRLRAHALTIRSSVRTQTDAMIDIGRDLVEIKDSLDHGAFAGWVELECGIAPRVAQLYMRAADWAKSNAKLISHLQPTSVMKLAAPSTPSTVLTLVAERVDAGEPVSAKVVDSLLRTAREETQEAARLAKEAAVPKRTQEARKDRQEREGRERDEWNRKRLEAEKRADTETAELSEILVANLDGRVLARVKEILRNTDVTREYHAIGRGRYVRLIDTIEDLQRTVHKSPKPISQPIADDLVKEGGITDLWVREAHMFKDVEQIKPTVPDLKKQLEDARNELVIAQRKKEYQRAGELAYGAIPRLEKQIVEAETTDSDFEQPDSFSIKGATAA